MNHEDLLTKIHRNPVTVEDIRRAISEETDLPVWGGEPYTEDFDQGVIGDGAATAGDFREVGGTLEALVGWEGAACATWTPVEGLYCGGPDAWHAAEGE